MTLLIKLLFITLIAAAIFSFFTFDIYHYLTLDHIKAQQAHWAAFYAQHTVLTLLIFGTAYVTVTALSLPAATLLTLLSGALFGFVPGLLMSSFSSSIGATLAFLMARYLLRDSIQQKYGTHLARINEGFKRDGAFYLFALRLAPVVPFFIVNILMALLPVRTVTCYVVSQLGMLTATAIYVYAGTELWQISSLSDIASPSLLIAFTALGLLPLLAKKALKIISKRAAHG